MFFGKKRKIPKTFPKVGECFLLVLKNGRYMPFQIIAQRMKGAFSVCALVGTEYPDAAQAIALMAGWTAHDIVAENTIYTADIKFFIRSNRWLRLGMMPLLRKPTMLWNEQNLMAKIKMCFGIEIPPNHWEQGGVFEFIANVLLGFEPWPVDNPGYCRDHLTPEGKLLVERLLSKK
jgi:hypothetical protein